MDIRIVARKIFIYLGISALTYGIFYLIAWLYTKFLGGVFSPSGFLLGIIIAPIFVALLFWFNKSITRFANKYLFYSLYNYQETITKLTNELNYYIELDKIVDAIINTIKQTMQLDKVGILLINEKGKQISYQIAKVIGFNEKNGISLVKDDFLTLTLKRAQQPLVRDELTLMAENAKTQGEAKNCQDLFNRMTKIEASLCLPLMSSQKLIGIIVLGAKVSQDAYTKEDIELLDTLSKQAGIAVDNAQLYQEVQDFNKNLQEKINELQVLNTATSKLLTTLDLGVILDTLMDGVVGLGKVDRGLLYLLDNTGKYLTPMHGRGGPESLYRNLKIEVKKSIFGKIIQSRKPVVVPDIFKVPGVNLEYAKAVETKAFAAFPLIGKDRILGVVGVDNKRTGRSIEAIDINLVQTFINVAGLAIDNARLYKEVSQFNVKLKHEVDKATAELREANAALKQLDKAKSEFLSIASHQLLTPLTPIYGYSSMILQGDYGKINAKLADVVDKMMQCSQRMVRLVDELLDISRIESGRVQYYLEPMDLRQILDHLMADMQIKAKQKKVKLTYDRPETLALVQADKDKIQDVMTNLIDNSLKYAVGTASIVGLEQKAKTVVFSVKDKGIGLDKDIKPFLFEKFSRGKSSWARHTEGLGLGLYVAKKYIVGHGGKIWAESQGKGQGSQFYFELPINNKPKKLVEQKKVSGIASF